jgi:hypothetical protein
MSRHQRSIRFLVRSTTATVVERTKNARAEHRRVLWGPKTVDR